MGDYTYRLSLWFQHPDADLSEIPLQLGLTAQRQWKKGDERIAPSGRVIGGVHNRSYCLFQFGQYHETDLPHGLRSALATLKPHKGFLSELSARGVSFSFFVGWFSDQNSRDVIDWEILRDMAELKLSLDLDIYAPDPSESSSSGISRVG